MIDALWLLQTTVILKHLLQIDRIAEVHFSLSHLIPQALIQFIGIFIAFDCNLVRLIKVKKSK